MGALESEPEIMTALGRDTGSRRECPRRSLSEGGIELGLPPYFTQSWRAFSDKTHLEALTDRSNAGACWKTVAEKAITEMVFLGAWPRRTAAEACLERAAAETCPKRAHTMAHSETTLTETLHEHRSPSHHNQQDQCFGVRIQVVVISSARQIPTTQLPLSRKCRSDGRCRGTGM